MNRRHFIQHTALATGATLAEPDYSRLGHPGPAQAERMVTRPDEPLRTYTTDEVARMIPTGVPTNIRALLTANLNQDYQKMNTDWFGTCQLEGLLKWGGRGLKPAYELATRWLAFHAERDNKLSDAQYDATYEGVKSRIIRGGVVPFSIYSANLGLSVPCHLLHQKTKNAQARQVCLDVAEAILHSGARDGQGLFAADDKNIFEFAIPDTGYFATRCMALASTLVDKPLAEVYRKQALLQAKGYFERMYDPAKGLSRTGYFNLKPSRTYWCRSQGWLIWTLTGMLRYLPDNHPDGLVFRQHLRTFTDRLVTHPGPSGGIRVWADEASSPEEVSGTAMVLGSVIEAVRRGWLPDRYRSFTDKAWSFIQSCVDERGKVRNAYTAWAVPAEAHQLIMDHKDRPFVNGMILSAAAELYG